MAAHILSNKLKFCILGKVGCTAFIIFFGAHPMRAPWVEVWQIGS